jgi:hypothetical protein
MIRQAIDAVATAAFEPVKATGLASRRRARDQV